LFLDALVTATVSASEVKFCGATLPPRHTFPNAGPTRTWGCSDARFTLSPCNDHVAGPIGIAPTSTEVGVRAPVQEGIYGLFEQDQLILPA
jgi:hypothetical protein